MHISHLKTPFVRVCLAACAPGPREPRVSQRAVAPLVKWERTRFKKSLLLLPLLDFFGSIFSRNFSLTISHCLQFSPEQERSVEPHVSGQGGGGSALRQHGCGYLVRTAAKRSPSEKGVCLGPGLPLCLSKTTQDWVTGTVGAVFFWAWEQDLGVTPGWSSERAVAYSCAQMREAGARCQVRTVRDVHLTTAVSLSH